MGIEEKRVITLEETGEEAPIDAVEGRVEKQLEELEEKARRTVAEGLRTTENDTSAH